MGDRKAELAGLIDNMRQSHKEVIESVRAVQGERCAKVVEVLMAQQATALTLIAVHVQQGSMGGDIAEALMQTVIKQLSASLALMMDNYPAHIHEELVNLMGHAFERETKGLLEVFRLATSGKGRK